MEVKTNPFYELYDRLYYAAAAGTAVISEDFRLKRAVEAFEPMAQKNKVFAKLHKMCSDLLTSEKASSEIADCIALAEALAVTQGTFLDSSETTPFSPKGFVPKDIPYSELTSLKEYIAKAKNSSKYVPESLSEFAGDPRLVTEFLKYCDTNSENFGYYAEVFKNVCGSSLVEPLFDSIDLTNPKATGRQIEFIADIAGKEHTARFKELAFNEEAPAGVRIAAINALGRYDECADDLIELFRTSKGKINTVALEALAKLSPPQAEPIFEKLAQKFKTSYQEAFKYARYPACSQYARDAIKKYLEENPDKNILPPLGMMLRNKTDVYDCFELILRRMNDLKAEEYSGGYVEDVLIQNLAFDKKNFEDYALMTEQLYHRFPDRMMFTRLFLEMERSGGKAFDILANDLHKRIPVVQRLVRDIGHDYSDDTMYLNLYSVLPRYPFFDHIPDGLLNVLVAADPVDENDPENNCQQIRHLCAVYNKPEDEEKAGAAALKYARICEKYYPNKVAVEQLMYYGKILPEGAITRMIYNTLEKKHRLSGTMYTMPSMHHEFARQIHKEFLEALEHIPKMDLPEKVKSDALANIRGAIKMTEDYIKRYDL